MQSFIFTEHKKVIIYNILVSSGIWKEFFIVNPKRSERDNNIKVIFGDMLTSDGKLKDERENVIFLYEFLGKDMEPFMKNIIFD